MRARTGLAIAAVTFVLVVAFGAPAGTFRAVIVPEREAATLREAKARADEATAAFEKLRGEAERRHAEALGSPYAFDWSEDFRVVKAAETRGTISLLYQTYTTPTLNLVNGVAQ